MEMLQSILALHRGHGTEHGKLLHSIWGYVEIMEKNMETAIQYIEVN